MPKLDLDAIESTNRTVGRTAATDCHYPDVDMHLDAKSGRFTHKDGSAY